MSWHKNGQRGRKGYHHGNLREALVEAALKLISEKGPGGLTFADAARAAGVSGAAPYRHFRDRDELMASVALRGFERFEQQLSEAWAGGKPDVFAALHELGRAYLGFARDEPAMFAAMFESGLVLSQHSEVATAADRAFDVLLSACEEISKTAPSESRPPARMMALHIWSFSHGIASLFGRGDAARRAIPMSPEDLLEAGVLVYLDGLGLRR
ncbi:MAG: TetR/AcrR family transcriptional regulator [Filomicrobium sp.]